MARAVILGLIAGLVVWSTACKSGTSPVNPSGCGADSVSDGHNCYPNDTATVALLVNNFTSDTLHALWWWYNSNGDSAIVAPTTTGVCLHFTPRGWAQIEGDLWYNGIAAGGNFTPAFNPHLAAHWTLDATFQAPPDDVTVVWSPSSSC